MGGGTALIIREERTEETSSTTITYYDKTYQEVKDAYDAGLPIYLQRYNDDEGFERSPLIVVSDPTSGNYVARVYNFAVPESILMGSESVDGQLITMELK